MGDNKFSIAYYVLQRYCIDTTGMEGGEAFEWAEALNLLDNDRSESKQRLISIAEKFAEDINLMSDNYGMVEKYINMVQNAIQKFGLSRLKSIEIVPYMPNANTAALGGATGKRIYITQKAIEDPGITSNQRYSQDYKANLNSINHISALISRLRPEQIEERDELIAEKLKLQDRFKSYRFSVTYPQKEFDCVVMHEIGHVIANQYFGQKHISEMLPNVSKEYAEKVRESVYATYKASIINGDIFYLSNYAAKNERDFFAEAFCMYQIKPSDLPIKIKTMVEEALKCKTMTSI